MNTLKAISENDLSEIERMASNAIKHKNNAYNRVRLALARNHKLLEQTTKEAYELSLFLPYLRSEGIAHVMAKLSNNVNQISEDLNHMAKLWVRFAKSKETK